MRSFVLIAGALAFSTTVHADVDFNRDIRPILSGRCFKCHGPDPAARESGLRLDEFDGATAALDSGMTAIVPGSPDQSELIARVSTTDADLRMPPTSQGEGLKPHEIELLREWIADGAKFDRHWSFVPPERSELPPTTEPGWCRTPIDSFVLNRLDAEGGIPHSSEADPHVLIRRVTLDLTGLPPTPEEVAAFVADPSDAAYLALVDRLLHSPAYGERWARVWLDLARYADSAGYADDPPRVIWKYRDWVIDAFNQNMPFDQFTIEQLAGDLLPEPTDSQLVATGFHRNTMTNSEGGTDDEEFRNAAIVDRVNTTMQVWMAMTIGCAQCHSHKYDPITQEEYYQVFDIFNQTADADQRDESPLLSTFTPEQLEQRTQLEAQIAAAEQKKSELLASAGIPETVTPPEGAPSARFVRIELPGADKILSLAEVQVFQGETNHALTGTASQLTTDYDGVASRAIDGNTDGNYYGANSTTHNMQGNDPWWEVDLGEAKPVERIVLWNRTDGGIGNRLNGCRIVLLDADRKALWVQTVAEAPAESGEYKVPQAVDQWTDADRTALAGYLMSNSPEVAAAQSEIDALKEQLNGLAPITTPIFRERPADQRRATHVQIRGNFLSLGPQVHAGVPSAFHPIGAEQPNRLDFAHWLVSDQNPLTARVVVNRVWEQMFGMGLVETTEDFGMQGQLPSHPELLDWLAVELMQPSEPGIRPWDLHHLLRLMVTSSTYRQTSDATTASMEADPQNRLLSRGPRHRLAAETVRDQALAIAGLLSPKMHGPSVQPPRPVLGLTAAFGGSTDWETSPGEDRYRRGLYTRWQRTMPYPSMDAFDAPSREVCTLRRIRTNTPLQALVTLNDPVYVEAAQGLARRILKEGGDTLDGRLEYGFLLCTSRPPTASELEVLRRAFEQARAAYENREAEATTMATDPLGPLPEGIAPIDAAAWTVMGNILLNLDETLARR